MPDEIWAFQEGDINKNPPRGSWDTLDDPNYKNITYARYRRADLVSSPAPAGKDRQDALKSWTNFFKLACEFRDDISAYHESVDHLLDHDETICRALSSPSASAI